MSFNLRKEINQLKKKLLQISAICEESVQKAINAITKKDESLAQSVIDGDNEIDRKEVELEEDCLKVLALFQPVAIDLRYIISILKINNDLERIGDLAVNIAERSFTIIQQPGHVIPEILFEMVSDVRSMLRKALDAFVNLDVAVAYEVWHMDDRVDEGHQEMYKIVAQAMQESPKNVDYLMSLISVSRNLERIADQTTNISEDIIYLLEGKVVRHRVSENFELKELKTHKNK